MPEQHFDGTFTFHGGQPVIGNNNEVTQYNYYGDQRDQIAQKLAELRELPQAAAIEPQIVVIEKAIESPTPAARGQLESALETLKSVEGAAAAVAAIWTIVAQHWPF